MLRVNVLRHGLGRGGDAALPVSELDCSLSARSMDEHRMRLGRCAAFALLASLIARIVDSDRSLDNSHRLHSCSMRMDPCLQRT